MNNKRTTDGGKGDSPRNLGPQFETNYGRIENFASNRVTLGDNGWEFPKRDGTVVSGFSTRLKAIEAYQQYYGGQ